MPLDEIELIVIDAMKSVAKAFGRSSEYCEFERLVRKARSDGENGRVIEARKGFAEAYKKYPEFRKLGAILMDLYQRGAHDGHHQSNMRFVRMRQAILEQFDKDWSVEE